MSPFVCDTFRELAHRHGVRPRQYGWFDAMVFVDLMNEVEQAGNCVIHLASRDCIPCDRSDALLQRLMACYAEPHCHVNDLREIQRELRRYGV